MAAAGDGAGEEQGAKGGSKKMMIIIIVVVLVAAAASVGVTLMLLGDDAPPEEAAASAEPVKQPAIYFSIQPAVTVTFNEGGKQRFVQASLTAMARSQDAISGLELHMPVVRHRLLTRFGAMDFNTLQTHDGKVAMLEAAREIMNAILVEQEVQGEIEAVLFENMVLQ